MAATVKAVQHLRKMRGGAQSQLLLASDGHSYITKCQNNPQDTRILANEMFATRIGRLLGLPMPDVAIVDVPQSFISVTPQLHVENAGLKQPWRSGLQFGSRLIGQCFDYLPASLHQKVMNLDDLARCLVFDKWTGNADGRQAIFAHRNSVQYKMTLIDHGYCFNAGQWSFPDCALHGVYYLNAVYGHVTGWESFEPALSSAEEMDIDSLWIAAHGIPAEWYQDDVRGLIRLIETLYQRRSRIRDLITAFRESCRSPFPNWTKEVSVPAYAASLSG